MLVIYRFELLLSALSSREFFYNLGGYKTAKCILTRFNSDVT